MKIKLNFFIQFITILTGALFLSCNHIEDSPQPIPSELTITGEALSITETTAILHGYANITELMLNAEFGIILSTDETPSIENGTVLKTKEINTENKYSVKVIDLEPGTVYYYKSFISNGETIRVGEVKSFTTAQYSALVSTNEATEVELFSATINGTLKVESIEELPSSVYFLFSSSSSELEALKLTGNNLRADVDENNKFKLNIKDLQYNTTYYYVACAKVHDRDYFGEVKTFKTLDISIVVDASSPTDITETCACLNGNYVLNTAGDFDVETHFCIGKTPTTLDEFIETSKDYNSEQNNQIIFHANITDLDFNTVYYYKAVATINGVNYYSQLQSFNTRDFDILVNSYNIDSVSAIRAFANCSISITSIEKFNVEYGVLYSSEHSVLNDLISNGRNSSNQERDEIGHISFELPLYKLNYNTKYYCVAFAKIRTKVAYSSVKEFTTSNLPNGAVDMGLGVLWAEHNLGASSPQEYGNTYAWGLIDSGNLSGWSDYPWSYGSTNVFTKYNDVDSKTILDKEDDAASALLGGYWRIPSVEDWVELINNCVWDYQSSGCIVTSKINGNSIFIPYMPGYSGFVRTAWASSLISINSERAYSLQIANKRSVSISDSYRYNSLAIRPISY